MGDINEFTSDIINREINPLIEENGIENIVFNVKGIKNIDEYGIEAIYESYLKLNQNNSHISLCEIPFNLRTKFQKLLRYINEKEDEIAILKQT